MKTSLVIGASGTIGSGVVKALQARDHAVRAVTSNPQRVGSAGGIDWVHADVVAGQGLEQAFEGVKRAFILAPPGHADQYAILWPLIDQARHSGVEKVVLMTAMGANAVETSPMRRAELALEASGIAFNIVRPNWFMQNFHTLWLHGIQSQGRIALPAGTAKVSFVDTRDVSQVAARLLASNDLEGQAFDLTGPQAIDHTQAAAFLSQVTGREIRYEEIPPEAMKQGLLGAGLREDYADFLLMIFGFLAQGYNAGLTTSVRDLLGREPGSFERYAADHKAAWAV
jgi:uncharacterized protein YbjT (DUF2867 family)